MYAEIITIGEEILIGQVIDSNSAWIGRQLNLLGLAVKKIISVSDNGTDILTALENSVKSADIIILTGGLGPTKDDITKKTLCDFFNASLVFNELIYKDLEEFFRTRGKEVSDTNRTQAEIPANCIPLRNSEGTAPGMWFEKNNKVIVSLPGVPYEMETLMNKYVIPKLREKFLLPAIIHKTIHTIGIAEADLSDLLEEFEKQLPGNIFLAYLPSPGFVRLRLTGKNDKNGDQFNELFNSQYNMLNNIILPYVFSYNDEKIQEVVGKLLKEKGETVATAESCTGGNIAHLLTLVPGSSDYFAGSVIAYSNQVKINLLKVKENDLNKYGAVSQQVVAQMAREAKNIFNTAYSIAVSGIAGPAGGTPDKPVGTTWIAVATGDEIISKKFNLGENRERNIEKASLYALNMLRLELIDWEMEINP